MVGKYLARIGAGELVADGIELVDDRLLSGIVSDIALDDLKIKEVTKKK